MADRSRNGSLPYSGDVRRAQRREQAAAAAAAAARNTATTTAAEVEMVVGEEKARKYSSCEPSSPASELAIDATTEAFETGRASEVDVNKLERE